MQAACWIPASTLTDVSIVTQLGSGPDIFAAVTAGVRWRYGVVRRGHGGRLFARALNRSLTRSHDRWFTRLFDRWFTRPLGRSVAQPAGILIMATALEHAGGTAGIRQGYGGGTEGIKRTSVRSNARWNGNSIARHIASSLVRSIVHSTAR